MRTDTFCYEVNMDKAKLKELVESGMTRQQIAEELGISYNRCSTVIRESGLNVKRKQAPPRIKNKELYDNIVNLRRAGMPYRQIAKELECALAYVGEVCRKNNLGEDVIDNRSIINTERVREDIRKCGFEYVEGYVSRGRNVTVLCKKCGNTFERTFKTFSDCAAGHYVSNKIDCPHCKRKQQEEEKLRRTKELELKREHDAHMKAEKKKLKEALTNSRTVNNELTKQLAIHVCKTCGREYCIAITGYNSERYCSELCQTHNFRRGHDSKRLKRMYSKKHDNDITLKKLYTRDEGVCYLCGNVCDWSDCEKRDGAFIAGANYPSIDHVTPLAKGGTHTWDNVRLAHMLCNAKKGAQ